MQVFNDEELGLLGKTRDNFGEYSQTMKTSSKISKKKKLNKTQDDANNIFYLTQGKKNNQSQNKSKEEN